MEKALHKNDKIRTILLVIAAVFAASFLLVSCGGYGGGGGGMYGGGAVMTPAPAMFGLTSPMNGATGVSTMPTLMWGASLYATGYHVYIKRDTDAAYPAPITVTTTSHTIATALDPSTLYDWKVTAVDASGMVTAGPSKFTTGP